MTSISDTGGQQQGPFVSDHILLRFVRVPTSHSVQGLVLLYSVCFADGVHACLCTLCGMQVYGFMGYGAYNFVILTCHDSCKCFRYWLSKHQLKLLLLLWGCMSAGHVSGVLVQMPSYTIDNRLQFC